MYNQQNMKVKIDNIFETICPFPVGYVYMSSDSTSPADIYGGTWTGVSNGRYIRANNTWGNGGSNIIALSQIPAHSHSSSQNVIADDGKWSSSPKGVIPQHAVESGVSTPFINKQLSTQVQGGGNRFIQHIKTCMFGTGLPKPQEGDNSCVNYHKPLSKFKNNLKAYVLSRLGIFICQPIQLLQQRYTEAIGRSYQIIDSLDHQPLGIQRVVLPRINTGRLLAAIMQKISTTLGIGAISEIPVTLELKKVSIINFWFRKAMALSSHIRVYTERLQHIQQALYRHIEIFIAGTECRNLVGGLV